MTPEDKLAAYEAMQREVETAHAETLVRLERLKSQGKTKTVTYREALGWKMHDETLLDLYRRYKLFPGTSAPWHCRPV